MASQPARKPYRIFQNTCCVTFLYPFGDPSHTTCVSAGYLGHFVNLKERFGFERGFTSAIIVGQSEGSPPPC